MSNIIKTTQGEAVFRLKEEFENEDKAIKGKEVIDSEVVIDDLIMSKKTDGYLIRLEPICVIFSLYRLLIVIKLPVMIFKKPIEHWVLKLLDNQYSMNFQKRWITLVFILITITYLFYAIEWLQLVKWFPSSDMVLTMMI